MLRKVTNTGQIGVNKDLSNHEIPDNAWTDADNIRFIDGCAEQSYGYTQIYDPPTVVPYHVRQVMVGADRYWIYAGTGKIYCVNGTTHTDLTRGAGGDYSGAANTWTSTLLSGIPILNDGSGSNYPQSWDLNIVNNFGNLSNWPANTYCKSIRAFKNYLVALNITKTTTNYPYMVKWSSPADPGAVPSTWDETDATNDAGEYDVAASHGVIVDGRALGEAFIIYTTNAMIRMVPTGGVDVFAFQPITGSSGLLAKNCVIEHKGMHFCVTGDDIVIHDGSQINSVLDKNTRRAFFKNLDTNNYAKTFVFASPFLNELCVAYPQAGSSVCDKVLVYNYKDRTVTFRDAPNLLHADAGLFESGTNTTWASDSEAWDSDITGWNQSHFAPDSSRVMWASSDTKLFLMDAANSANGTQISAYLERNGMSFDSPEAMKLIKGIRPRIYGTTDGTVTVSVAGTNTPYETPTYTDMTHTIGTTISNDCLVSGRYIHVKFATGTAYQWRLDSYDIDYEIAGVW